MCRKPCCPPQGSSDTGAIIAVIAGIIIAASVLRAILGLLVTLLLIVLISTAALTVIGLVTWAVIKRHRRTAITAVLACRASAVPPGYVRMIGNQPTTRLPGTTPPGRAVTTGHERLARQLAAAIVSSDDPAAAEALIRRALREHRT
jgi:hypothetical protein